MERLHIWAPEPYNPKQVGAQRNYHSCPDHCLSVLDYSFNRLNSELVFLNGNIYAIKWILFASSKYTRWHVQLYTVQCGSAYACSWHKYIRTKWHTYTMCLCVNVAHAKLLLFARLLAWRFVPFLSRVCSIVFCIGLQIWKLHSKLFIDSRQNAMFIMLNIKRLFEIICFGIYGLRVWGLLKIIKSCI